MKTEISINNPFAPSIIFNFFGLIGFVFYLIFINSDCNDYYFLSFFTFSIIATIIPTIFFANKLQQCKNIKFTTIPTWFIYISSFIKIFIAYTIFQNQNIAGLESRFSAYSDPAILVLSGALGYLYFPLFYFCTNSKFLKKIIFSVFIIESLSVLFFASSKSTFLSILFSLLSYSFFKFPRNDNVSKYMLFSMKTFLFMIMALILQLIIISIIYNYSSFELIQITFERIINNFDTAIYGCMISKNASAPNSFFEYAFLSLLKKLDLSYYDIQFYNVPQWLLYETLGIDKEGRLIFPNDNLATGLYFAGGGYFSPAIFACFLFCWFYSSCKFIQKIHHLKPVNPVYFAILFYSPIFFKSTQEFMSMMIFYIIFLLLLRCRV